MRSIFRGLCVYTQRYIHVEFYILQSDDSTDNFFRALEEAAERGVVVRVLLDHFGINCLSIIGTEEVMGGVYGATPKVNQGGTIFRT